MGSQVHTSGRQSTMENNLTIRKAIKEDCSQIYSLIKELFEYQGIPDAVKTTIDQLEEDGFNSDPPSFHCLVVEDSVSKLLVGYTLYYYAYSSSTGKSVYMDDIYVKPEFRGKGLGLGMWKTLLREAIDKSCTRCDFEVLESNKPSREFYELKGAANVTQAKGYLVYRLYQDNMMKLVE